MSEAPPDAAQIAADERIHAAAVEYLDGLAGKGLIEPDFEVGPVTHHEDGSTRLVIKARMMFGPATETKENT